MDHEPIAPSDTDAQTTDAMTQAGADDEVPRDAARITIACLLAMDGFLVFKLHQLVWAGESTPVIGYAVLITLAMLVVADGVSIAVALRTRRSTLRVAIRRAQRGCAVVTVPIMWAALLFAVWFILAISAGFGAGPRHLSEYFDADPLHSRFWALFAVVWALTRYQVGYILRHESGAAPAES